jgi:hypothetical protein
VSTAFCVFYNYVFFPFRTHVKLKSKSEVLVLESVVYIAFRQLSVISMMMVVKKRKKAYDYHVYELRWIGLLYDA